MTVRNAILGLLVIHPRHGYELRAAFEALMGGGQNWEVKPAQIYSTLTRLEESGLIEQAGLAQEGGPEKRIYQITPAGQADLITWFETPVEGEHQRDEFYLKLVLCLATQQADPLHMIQAQRSKLYQELHRMTAFRTHTDPRTALAQVLLLDKVVMHLEADLRWLDMIEQRLDEIKRQPAPQPELRRRGRPKKHVG